jgi:hypothetical protein
MKYIKYSLLNVNTKEVEIMTVDEIIENINSDRSESWTPYDMSDWQEGLRDFTEYIILGKVK